MIVFGDLDMTVLDELPAGRVRRSTTIWARGDLGEHEALGRGARPRSRRGGAPTSSARSSTAPSASRRRRRSSELERLRDGPLEGLRLGLLHGQLRPRGRREVMDRFRAGAIDVLVATTVDRGRRRRPGRDGHGHRGRRPFRHRPAAPAPGPGRSQLAAESGATCSGRARRPKAQKPVSRRSLRATDGFVLAELDLELRGEGTILGARQTGSQRPAAGAALHGIATSSSARGPSPEGAPWRQRPRPPGPRAQHAREELSVFLDEDDAAWLFKELRCRSLRCDRCDVARR